MRDRYLTPRNVAPFSGSAVAFPVVAKGKGKKKDKRAAARKPPKKKPARAKPRAAAPPAEQTIVQLHMHEGPMAKKKNTAPKGKNGKPLHGAALAAHRRAGSHHGGGHRKNAGNPSGHGKRRRRRNPHVTFVQAAGKVLGTAAAMFGSGVLVTLGTSKIAPGSPWSLYGIPAATALLGAGIATRYPLVGGGVAAGAAATFVLPVASRMLGPGLSSASTTTTAPTASTVSALHAVAMGGSGWRSLNTIPRVGAVRMGAVAMGGRTARAY